ncbi:hypothetical protein DLE60_00165, partial [Micromonospora globispora]|uniref:hypothetical protein n=1 Tax=Micromonospora globispora TaxID=1450148 RepID=UPI000D80968F
AYEIGSGLVGSEMCIRARSPARPPAGPPRPPWRDAAARPVDGLGIRRETVGDGIVYHLD